MRNEAIEYPHPVLNEYTKDYVGCDFSIKILDHNDSGNNLSLEIGYDLQCPGMDEMLSRGDAKIILRLTCFRTSYREMREMNIGTSTVITIPKKDIADTLDLHAMIVASREMEEFDLPEFNRDYFGGAEFMLRKGDVIANEPGIKIKLNTILEKEAASVILVRGDKNATEMDVHFASAEDEDPSLTEYIYITLPDAEYKSYANLRTKKHLKNGVERFLQSSLILPAITEAISKLRMEEMLAPEEWDRHYKGTIWADSILKALEQFGIYELSTSSESDFVLANKILGNVESDAINNLMQKMTEWSTIRQEDEVI